MYMKIYIKNMVCIRCKMVVKSVLDQLGLIYLSINIGEVEIILEPTELQLQMLELELNKYGLELMDNKKQILIEKIIQIIVEMIHYEEEVPKTNFSDLLSSKLGYDYTYLANLFSEVTGNNIQHYIIDHKIEHVKELLVYGRLSLSEIAHKMHYSSVAHLSNQFKKVTGFTSNHYKHIRRIPMVQLPAVNLYPALV